MASMFQNGNSRNTKCAERDGFCRAGHIYGYSVPFMTLLTLPFMQYEVQSGYFEHACLFVDKRLLAPAWRLPDDLKEVCAATSCISSYHVLFYQLVSVFMANLTVHLCGDLWLAVSLSKGRKWSQLKIT